VAAYTLSSCPLPGDFVSLHVLGHGDLRRPCGRLHSMQPARPRAHRDGPATSQTSSKPDRVPTLPLKRRCHLQKRLPPWERAARTKRDRSQPTRLTPGRADHAPSGAWRGWQPPRRCAQARGAEGARSHASTARHLHLRSTGARRGGPSRLPRRAGAQQTQGAAALCCLAAESRRASLVPSLPCSAVKACEKLVGRSRGERAQAPTRKRTQPRGRPPDCRGMQPQRNRRFVKHLRGSPHWCVQHELPQASGTANASR